MSADITARLTACLWSIYIMLHCSEGANSAVLSAGSTFIAWHIATQRTPRQLHLYRSDTSLATSKSSNLPTVLARNALWCSNSQQLYMTASINFSCLCGPHRYRI